ncbi:AAA family ATPase [Rhizobium sp. CFBP 13726]|uniref:AAA family ATPase n=1 Tax=Rhizobium sp. CFBP 13726 TaxID=2775296 RepID=UPI001786DDF1|nr:AAA family ATPase [Rhizobium sp. CFBP 13726]MBD8651057.1 AAA family ATPase [Rhizobium sp. CFBP 13726]
MRILSISGQNIASLAQPFAIDFTTEPLAGAGLFVITGETGAGKSSILDAMCLALYGDAPRLAGSASDEVPDPSGRSIRARDSRSVLRRGAAQGWAEVRFTARDGQDYIARWQARRARDRVDGQLQNVSRSLARASDGQIIAGQSSIVAEQIAALTGFSYDEFRRTVLLAQGDFDAFLRADTNDRAGLLEKVTGTGLYRAVSSRIYDRTEAARRVHSALVQRREGHNILTDESRAALEAERLVALEANHLAGEETKTIQAGLARHTRHAETARLVTLAEAELEQAVTHQSDADADHTQLARIELAGPLRAPWQTVQNSKTRVIQVTDLAAKHKILSDEAVANADVLKDVACKAEAEHSAQEDRFKQFGPLWDQSATLDNRILSAMSELDASRSQTAALEQDATDALHTFQTLQREETETRETLRVTEAELAGLSPDCTLADSWAQTRQHIAEHYEAQSSLTQATTDIATHDEQIRNLTLALTELAIKTQADTREEARLHQETIDHTDMVSATEANHPPGRGMEHQTLATALADMRRAEHDHNLARSDAAAAETSAKLAREAIDVAKTDAASAGQAMATASAQAAALTAPAQRADMAVSEAAQQLRLRLEPGIPCPVCGSEDHPTHADSALADLAASLRADLVAARAAVEAARDKQAAAQRTQDGAQKELELAGKNAQTANAKITTALADWQEAQGRAARVPLCPSLPGQIGEGVSRLDTLLAAADSARSGEAEAQMKLAELRQKLADVSRMREDLRKIIAGHAAAREDLNSKLAFASSNRALSQRAAETAEAQVTRHAKAISPLLEQLGETLGDPELFDRLENRVLKIAGLRKTRETTAGTLISLAPLMATAESRAENSAKNRDVGNEAVATRLNALQSLQAERAPLLGGEATSTHRTRHNEARKAAAAALDTARQAFATAMNGSAAAQAKAENTADALSGAQKTLETAEAALANAFALLDLVQGDLDQIFALEETEIVALRQRLRKLDDDVISARAALNSRRMDHAEAEAAGMPEEPPEALSDALSTLDAAIRTRAERIGGIDSELQRDVVARAALTDLETEIKQAQSELDVWEAVNHAAGSRSGDKFARVAQSITLDVLVDHANHHLVDLNPRYRLRRAADLALQVEDRDMGDEARATRSLSGGERFLVSLALALALSRMGGKGGLSSTLFIDEGFGSLDAGSLDLAIDALESLQSQGRQVGVISHVEAMKERIPTRIAVNKQGSGKSAIEVHQA